MATSSPSRRRQRSVRVTVASALLAIASLVVLAALPTQSPAWLSASSVFGLICGITAARIVYTELLQSRREAAADRASQARAYQRIFAQRTGEHDQLTSVLTDRLASREGLLRALEDSFRKAEKRAAEAETRVKRESRRANESMELVAELQSALEIRRAEEADELASWESALSTEADSGTVVDLLAWEDRANGTIKGDSTAPVRKQA